MNEQFSVDYFQKLNYQILALVKEVRSQLACSILKIILLRNSIDLIWSLIFFPFLQPFFIQEWFELFSELLLIKYPIRFWFHDILQVLFKRKSWFVSKEKCYKSLMFLVVLVIVKSECLCCSFHFFICESLRNWKRNCEWTLIFQFLCLYLTKISCNIYISF